MSPLLLILLVLILLLLLLICLLPSSSSSNISLPPSEQHKMKPVSRKLISRHVLLGRLLAHVHRVPVFHLPFTFLSPQARTHRHHFHSFNFSFYYPNISPHNVCKTQKSLFVLHGNTHRESSGLCS